jgi:hypothetical protein
MQKLLLPQFSQKYTERKTVAGNIKYHGAEKKEQLVINEEHACLVIRQAIICITVLPSAKFRCKSELTELSPKEKFLKTIRFGQRKGKMKVFPFFIQHCTRIVVSTRSTTAGGIGKRSTGA